jgi:ADP-ribose pyrophosphatase YjhB (NUDIX family)
MNNYENIDWVSWQPQQRAVIVYITDRKRQKVLLIMKKTGLGKGKVNAPGGRLEPGESFLEAAIRECREEVSHCQQLKVSLYLQIKNEQTGKAVYASSWVTGKELGNH